MLMSGLNEIKYLVCYKYGYIYTHGACGITYMFAK